MTEGLTGKNFDQPCYEINISESLERKFIGFLCVNGLNCFNIFSYSQFNQFHGSYILRIVFWGFFLNCPSIKPISEFPKNWKKKKIIFNFKCIFTWHLAIINASSPSLCICCYVYWPNNHCIRYTVRICFPCIFQ